ncbi:hypothetical protein KPL71_014771 [Citrus sinensis]|uniref:Uncharacterized protein n=1 Tax=Citrus sinensis TaxID=2711 RepID=A0ACB8KE08_CITSI|nr:hypothetical protein KPL71_014771 [Citrus sinensis]
MVEGETSRSKERSTETISGDSSSGRRDLSNPYSAPVIGGQKIDVEKFDGKINFGMWRREVMDVLIQIDLDVVLKNKRHLYDEEIWDRMNEKACGQIRSCLTKEVKYLVKDEECAVTLWRTLEEKYLLKSPENRLYTMSQVYGFRMKHGVSMHDHISRFEKLPADLKNLDEDIKDEVKAIILLHSLPEEYSHFVTTLIYGKSVIVFKDVCTTLTNLEMQNNDKNSERVSFEALVSKDWVMEKKKKLGGKNSRSKLRSRNIARDECAFCHENGHWRKDWPKVQKRDGKKPAPANMAWKDEDSDYSLIVMGNDQPCRTMGIGIIQLKMFDGTVRELKKVRFIPVFKKNLISVGTLEGKGYKVTIKDGKKTRVKFGTANHDTREILAYVHSDVWGPTKTASIGGSHYFVTFVDDFSRRVWVYTMRAKDDVLEIFVKWKKLNEGIKRYFMVRHTPQQNGVAERMNRTLLEKVRCILSNAGLDKKFWAEAVSYASHLINRVPSTVIRGKTPMEMWSGKHAQDYDFLRIFRCPAYYHVKDGKLDPRARKAIFVGFKDGVKGFKLWNLEDKKFVENKTKEVLQRVKFDATSYVPVNSTSKKGSTMEVTPTVEEEVVSSDVPQNEETIYDVDNDDFIAIRRPRREIKKPGWLTKYMVVAYALLVIDDDIPNTFSEALRGSERKKAIGNKWVYTKKKGSLKQSIPRYKARLVAKGFAQKEGIEYNEVFSPVVKYTSIRILLTLLAEYELELAQLDVKTTFLHGDLVEEIYMIQPCGFKVAGKENHVCRLIKSLYGLKQSPRQWYKRFDQFIQGQKFTRSEHDHCVYFRRLLDKAFIYLLLYVNDMLISSKNRDEIERLKKQLASEFKMKDLGDAQRILGMEIRRDKKNGSVWLTQKSYLKKVLKRLGMDDKTKPVCTSLAPHFKLSSSLCPRSQEERDYMARVPYASAVGSLIYAMVCTRPDISQAVSMVSRYMHNPGINQWLAVKWILRYLYGTVDVGLLFKNDCGQQCVGYCDSDFAGDLDKRRSTTGYVFTLGGGPVSWRSILQSIIALSTMEAEYMAVTEAVKEALWLKGLLGDLGVIQENIAVFCDNQSAIFLAKNQTYHARTKHIDVKYHYVREIIESGVVLLRKIDTKDNPSDMLTKCTCFRILRTTHSVVVVSNIVCIFLLASKFIEDGETTSKRCFKGLCPNLKTRYQLSKKAETEVKALVELKEEARRFDDQIFYRTIVEEVWLKSNKGYEAFKSRLSTLKSIQDALTDVNVSIVGVYGMGGIGKTTLVKEFARQASEEKLFDQVVFSEVSQTPDIKKIQGEIAEKLGLELSEEAESRRASKLYERLKNHKKILVILDKIWKYLDLETVGIPFGDDHRGCKLLLTAKDRNVSLSMGYENNFLICILNEQEAWRLFKIMAGNYVENRELKSTATSVAKACGGLPIALTTVAKALRNKELPVWKNALQELQTPSEASFDGGVPVEAYSTIELSYKYLRGFLARKLKRFKISIGNKSFMASLPVTKDWFRSRSHFLINNNHERLRELKLKLDFMDICSMKLQAINNVEYLLLDKLQGVKNVLFDLDTKGVPQLKLLWVQNNPDFFCIVDSMEMVACDAFPLLESLTLHNLINMERICIDRLKVESFNKLKTIKVENCNELSNIFWLSTAKCLPRLERIAVINCSKMKEIFATGGEADVDNNNATEKIELAQLRSLSLGNLPEVTTFFRKLKTPSASLNRQGLQEELTSSCSNEINLETLLFNGKVGLPNLEALEISEINVDKIWHYNHRPVMLPRFQSLTRLIVCHCNKLKYIFLVSMIQSFEHLQQVEIVNCRGLQEIISEDRVDHVTPRFVFQRVTTLILQELPELKCLYHGMLTSEWPALKILVVSGCDKLKTFAADSSQNNEDDQLGIPAQRPLFLFKKILPNLESLALSGKDVKMILDADFPQHLFGSLKKLDITYDDSACFPIRNVLERFHNLELLLLYHCSYEELFSTEGCLEKRLRKLAMIKCIELGHLNHLKQLCKQDSKLDSIFQYLEILKVYHCQNLLSLLPSSSVSFRNLTKLVAVGCKELIHFVTSSTAKTLVRLVSVQVYGCRAMTEVVINDKEGVDIEEIVFSKLKALILCDLDSLTSFCSANYTFKFPSLEYLEVIGCPKMKTFTSGESNTPPRVNVSYGE